MSLIRLLPALRAPLPFAQRSCVSAFSSSSSRRAAEPDSNPEAYFDELMDPVPNGEGSHAAPSSEATIEDGPPVAPAGSYPRTSPQVNPITENKQRNARPPVTYSEKPLFAVSVKASRNNTIVTFAKPTGHPLVTLSGGKLGFKKSNRNGYEAGYQCAVGIIGALEQEMLRSGTNFEWELYLKGFGQGRDAMLTAITTGVGESVKTRLRRITDRTPLKIGGTRGQKTRRV